MSHTRAKDRAILALARDVRILKFKNENGRSNRDPRVHQGVRLGNLKKMPKHCRVLRHKISNIKNLSPKRAKSTSAQAIVCRLF